MNEVDLYLFGQGVHYGLYHILGAHIAELQGQKGVRFAVWAPDAYSVALAADFNHWNPSTTPMRCAGHAGVWEVFVPGIGEGEKYKFVIITKQGAQLWKSDPYAFQMEHRPKTASIVTEFRHFPWSDQQWMDSRKEGVLKPHPMNIYEVHLGSWRRPYGKIMNYRELGEALASYCQRMGYTHVELLPVLEHPLDESWGYQVSGFFAPTSRFGSLRDFQWMVNYLHEQKVGVIIDWVPGHFPVDDFALARFDGTALYEHEDPRQGLHPHWNTCIFNFGRHEVTNFLIASALFWLEQLHIDGLRVDAVASMLYADYGREAGEWIPNRYGGNENIEAIAFLKHLNAVVHDRVVGVVMIAEESTSFPKVTHPLGEGGLGFDMKWNMGWMNDTLRYFSKDPVYRTHHQNDLTFGLLYAFSEQFLLPLSHDEVVHGKKSLLSKMPGDWWRQFAQLRLLLSYQICQPGKKLLFMGGEIGQWTEWCSQGALDWALEDYPMHQKLQEMVRTLNHLYLRHGALWEKDFSAESFAWIDCSDTKNSVLAYWRLGFHERLICIHHFTAEPLVHYRLHLPHLSKVQEIFNSDNVIFGGSTEGFLPCHVDKEGLVLSLPPLATVIFAV